MDLVMVGAGEAARKHWIEGILGTPGVNVVAVVDHDVRMASRVATMLGDRIFACYSAIQAAHFLPTVIDAVALVLTPDHFPTIVELMALGFTRFIVEKPLVSRMSEIAQLRELVAAHPEVKIFAVDQYIAKTLQLQDLLTLHSSDPRRKFFVALSPDFFSMARMVLGPIEGVTVTVEESGDFCLPDLAKRPWLRNDPEIGGMLLDLGTHVFAPLIAARVITSAAEVRVALLSKLGDDDEGFLPVISATDVEMHVSALLRENGIPISVSFGKVPGTGGIWSLAVRFKNGEYRGGLRSGQPAVLAMHDGFVASQTLSVPPVRYILCEAELYFAGELPGFDGNVGAVLGSLEISARIRKKYFADMWRC